MIINGSHFLIEFSSKKINISPGLEDAAKNMLAKDINNLPVIMTNYYIGE